MTLHLGIPIVQLAVLIAEAWVTLNLNHVITLIDIDWTLVPSFLFFLSVPIILMVENLYVVSDRRGDEDTEQQCDESFHIYLRNNTIF